MKTPLLVAGLLCAALCVPNRGSADSTDGVKHVVYLDGAACVRGAKSPIEKLHERYLTAHTQPEDPVALLRGDDELKDVQWRAAGAPGPAPALTPTCQPRPHSEPCADVAELLKEALATLTGKPERAPIMLVTYVGDAGADGSCGDLAELLTAKMTERPLVLAWVQATGDVPSELVALAKERPGRLHAHTVEQLNQDREWSRGWTLGKKWQWANEKNPDTKLHPGGGTRSFEFGVSVKSAGWRPLRVSGKATFRPRKLRGFTAQLAIGGDLVAPEGQWWLPQETPIKITMTLRAALGANALAHKRPTRIEVPISVTIEGAGSTAKGPPAFPLQAGQVALEHVGGKRKKEPKRLGFDEARAWRVCDLAYAGPEEGRDVILNALRWKPRIGVKPRGNKLAPMIKKGLKSVKDIRAGRIRFSRRAMAFPHSTPDTDVRVMVDVVPLGGWAKLSKPCRRTLPILPRELAPEGEGGGDGGGWVWVLIAVLLGAGLVAAIFITGRSRS